MLADIGQSRRILVSGECNSWPRCYHDLLVQDHRSARCVGQPGAACFANSWDVWPALAMEDQLLPAAMRGWGRGSEIHSAEKGDKLHGASLLQSPVYPGREGLLD